MTDVKVFYKGQRKNVLKSLFSRSDYVRIKDMCELKTISES
jgi:hypothetical protein